MSKWSLFSEIPLQSQKRQFFNLKVMYIKRQIKSSGPILYTCRAQLAKNNSNFGVLLCANKHTHTHTWCSRWHHMTSHTHTYTQSLTLALSNTCTHTDVVLYTAWRGSKPGEAQPDLRANWAFLRRTTGAKQTPRIRCDNFEVILRQTNKFGLSRLNPKFFQKKNHGNTENEYGNCKKVGRWQKNWKNDSTLI